MPLWPAAKMLDGVIGANAVLPSRHQMINYIFHDESAALYGEGILVDLRPGEFLLRVEARGASGPGNWFHGPFDTRPDADRYADYLLSLGRQRIREENALPRVWKDGSSGNAVDVIRYYKVRFACPAISSVVAPQRETGTVMARPEHRSAGKAGFNEYAGQGQQLSVPVSRVRDLHGIDLVERVFGDTSITRP